MNYKTLTLTLLLGLATHTSLQAGEMMNHQGHDMARKEGMNHEGHDMAAMQTEQTLTKGVISRNDAPKGKVGSCPVYPAEPAEEHSLLGHGVFRTAARDNTVS
ncbi:hypothetical protein [Aeromonas caviae]|uniref:hypothetical protein n=1 Tax=Aeromonas caviae TaxID=648 RepID=UPI0025B63DBE|nr:hypothetical protein [Aeromonas caviae]